MNRDQLIQELQLLFQGQNSKIANLIDHQQIENWLGQFPSQTQNFILSETLYLFKINYYSFEDIEKTLAKFLLYLKEQEGSSIFNIISPMPVNSMKNKAHIEFSSLLSNLLNSRSNHKPKQEPDYPVFYYINDVVESGELQIEQISHFIDNAEVYKSAKLYLFNLFSAIDHSENIFSDLQTNAQEKYLDLIYTSANVYSSQKIHSSMKAALMFEKIENELGPEPQKHPINAFTYQGVHTRLASIYWSNKNNWVPLFKNHSHKII